MNIALTTTGPNLESSVFYEFSQTPCLLIVNVETMDCIPVEHSPTPGSDLQLARTIVEHRCEAVITGKLEEQAFDILADDGVTRYACSDLEARKALEAMENRDLQLIRNPEGTNSCSGHHHA